MLVNTAQNFNVAKEIDSIKVMSFNLKRDFVFARKNSWNTRRDAVLDLIEDVNPSIIGTQEVISDMREYLEDELPQYGIYGTGRSKRLLGEHSDVFIRDDRCKVNHNESFWLSKRPLKRGSRALLAFFPRICTVCEMTVKSWDTPIRILNTHFDHISPVARNLSSRILVATINRLNKRNYMPSIIMGDLNAKPNSKAIKLLSDNLHGYKNIKLKNVFSNEINNIHNTYHGFKGRINGKQIDYIFVTEEFKILDAYIDVTQDDGVFPSDHYPIVANLTLKG